MLVVHPQDSTTSMLAALYCGRNATVLTQHHSCTEIRSRIYHTPPAERIMLLGHGSEKGLLSRSASPPAEFDRLIISRAHAYPLRRHGANLIGIWCHANLFARQHGLRGLFSGMVITELSEAEEYGIPTTRAELDRENLLLFSTLRRLLDADTPLHLIPELMPTLDTTFSPLTVFNYQSFYVFL